MESINNCNTFDNNLYFSLQIMKKNYVISDILKLNFGLILTFYRTNMQGLSQDFHNRVSKIRFQRDRVS